MTSQQEKHRPASDADIRSPPRSARLVAIVFVVVFALSVGTVIYTGLSVQAPRTELAAGLPVVGMTVAEPRLVNLVFDAGRPFDDVTLLVTLPDGIELAGHPGEARFEWRTKMQAGKNVLPLELVARTSPGGQLAARVSAGEQSKLFRVHLDVGAR